MLLALLVYCSGCVDIFLVPLDSVVNTEIAVGYYTKAKTFSFITIL